MFAHPKEFRFLSFLFSAVAGIVLDGNKRISPCRQNKRSERYIVHAFCLTTESGPAAERVLYVAFPLSCERAATNLPFLFRIECRRDTQHQQ